MAKRRRSTNIQRFAEVRLAIDTAAFLLAHLNMPNFSRRRWVTELLELTGELNGYITSASGHSTSAALERLLAETRLHEDASRPRSAVKRKPRKHGHLRLVWDKPGA